MADDNLNVEQTASQDDFKRILDKANKLISGLKKLDPKQIYDELKILNVSITPNPSLQQVNVELLKVQAAKDRLSEILVDTHKNFIVMKRVCELLTEGWSVYSDQNSAEKRKGEAQLKMSQFVFATAEAESLFKASSHVLKNLDSKNDTLSRQVTVFSLMMKFDPKSDYMNVETAKTLNAAYKTISHDANDTNDANDVNDRDDRNEEKDEFKWEDKEEK